MDSTLTLASLLDIHVNELAKMAEVASPDTDVSPGAKFLEEKTREIGAYIVAQLDDGNDLHGIKQELDHGDDDLDEYVSAPVYRDTIYGPFIDLGLHMEQLPDSAGPGTTYEVAMTESLMEVARRLASGIVEYVLEMFENWESEISDDPEHLDDTGMFIGVITWNSDVNRWEIVPE